MPGELEHAGKCRCKHSSTLDEIANTSQDVTKRTNIQKYTPYKSSDLKEKQPLRVEFKDRPRKRVAEVAKKNSCHNCGSTDHYAKDCPKAKKKVYAIEIFPEEESPTEDSDSDSMGDAIREQSDEEEGPREEFLVEYQEEPPLEIQDIQLEAGMPQDTASTNLCKHTQDAQTFLVTPTKGMAYTHETVTKTTQVSAQDPLEELPNEFREGQFSTTLTSKQKLSLLKILRKNRTAFSIGEEPLGKIRGHDIELYLDVERPYPPILRRPPNPASLETRKEIEKHINELLDMDVIRNIGNNEIVKLILLSLSPGMMASQACVEISEL
ncbi:hypothetical protein O181_085438 [Austropuccinia psidii MF-1]|uniref:CCHC-type domain-containing protein n=1 Tax=Austropuccinia psidii MF-1 TaxID=1389203 RepID=A0A9Q3ILI2_9BASI|nr:hypothetical protein [Austropuccinia psidii MF-1]